jgi:hypothetical protein
MYNCPKTPHPPFKDKEKGDEVLPEATAPFAGLVDANNNSAGIISRADIEDNDAADMNQHTANAHQHCAGTKYQNN